MSNELQQKMYNYDVQPPVESWNRIVAALAEEGSLAERLKNFEAFPPATAWNKIEAELGTEETKVISLKRKNALRYIAAAVVFALIVFSGTFLLENNKNNDTVSQSNATNKNTAVTSSERLNTPYSTTANQNDLIHHSADRQIAYTKPKRIAVSKFIARLQQITAPEKVEPQRKISFDNTVDRYMVYSDGDGNAMRLPKKLYDAISCVQFDISCKDKMQSMQQKIANASFTSDFTAVLEMLNNLKENQ